MASAKPAPTTRRSRTGSKPAGSDEPEISRARWAGVALIMTALLGAVTLAVISPSDQDRSGQVATVTQTAVPSIPADTRLPTEQPEILQPEDGVTSGEWETTIIVALPEDPLPRRLLKLQILRNGKVLGEKPRPEAGDVTFQGIRLKKGANVLIAALQGPGGLGPLSEPVTIMLDDTRPELAISTPEEDFKTSDRTVVLSGTSEPGATVDIKNATKGWVDPAVVGPSGSFTKTVPLVEGKNRIVIKATDGAGNVRRVTRFVIQQDGRPVVKLNAPKNVKLASLPATIRLRVEVTDASGDSIVGADAIFTLIIPGQSSETNEDVTNASGRASWRVTVPKGSQRDDIILGNVKVTRSNGQTREASVEIKVS
ncbi:MAG: Ig-like domain-containing protein [Chloroflexota bacterium]